MNYWSFKPIFGSYPLVFLLSAGLLALLLIAPQFARLKPAQRRLLLLVRLLLIGLIVLALLRPMRVSTSREAQSAVLVLMADQSRSMQLPNASGDKSRWEAQFETLSRVSDRLRNLQKELDVRLYAYDQTLHELDLSSGRFGLPVLADGQQTDIGSTLYEAVQRELGKRLAGVILLGDGAQTAYSPQIEVQQAARELARLDYPLYSIVFGPAGQATQARDIAIENLPERYAVFVKNELVIAGALRVRGYVNRRVPLELIVQDAANQTQVLGPVEVSAREDNELVPFQISFVPQVSGEYKVTVRAQELPGETITQNNQLQSFLTVLDGGLRVLYLFGDLLGEQRLLRRSLGASPDIQVESMFVDPRNRSRWPIGKRLQLDKYDVVLVENVDSSAIRDSLKELTDWIENGRGFMMIGGFHSFGPGGYRNTPLADALPVRMGRFEKQDVDPRKPVSRDLHYWGELPIRPKGNHSIVRLGTDDRNQSLWESLPALNGANKLQVKPAARTLLATPDDRPLLIAGQYGSGRVLAFAGNSTGLWWQYGRSNQHRRFWRQSILWLAHREDSDRSEVWVKLDRRRLNPGERVDFSAGARNSLGEDLADAEFQIHLVEPDGSRTALRFARDGATVSGSSAPLTKSGDYLVELRARDSGTVIGATQASFQVLDRDVEWANPAANYELMSRLAMATQNAGGKTLAPEQLGQLLEDIAANSTDLEVEVQTKWQLGDTAADAWGFFLCVLSVITAEWVMRKRWGMV